MMTIRDLVYQASAGRRSRARKELARQWAVGFCVITAAASLGVVTGVLFAPKSGKETRADLKRKAIKSVDTIEKAIQEQTDAAKTSIADGAEEVADTIQEASAKAKSSKKDA